MATSPPEDGVAAALLSPDGVSTPHGKPLIRREGDSSNGERLGKFQPWHLAMGEGAELVEQKLVEQMRSLKIGADPPNPFVTFVIHTEGRSSLNRTLESLIAQGDPEWEAIVVCDPGPCHSVTADSRIKSLAFEKRLGDAHNAAGQVRNEGIKIAKGDFIAYVDDDDILDGRYVATLKTETKRSPSIQLVVFRMCYVHPPGNSSVYEHQCKNEDRIISPEQQVKTADQLTPSYAGVKFAIRRQTAQQTAHSFGNKMDENIRQLVRLQRKGTNIAVSQHVMYYAAGAQLTLHEALTQRALVVMHEYRGVLELLLPEGVANVRGLLTEHTFLLGSFISILTALSVLYSPALAKIIVFFLTGLGLILLNQHILKELNFSYPMSLSGLGMLATLLIIRFSVDVLGVAEISPKALEAMSGQVWYRKVLPIAVAKALTLGLGNATYLYLGLGMIQILKCANPALVVAVGTASGLPKPTKTVISFVGLIILGTAMVVHGDLHWTVAGLMIMFASEFCEATHVTLTQTLLHTNFNLIDGLYILTPPGCACLFSMAAVFEWPQMIKGHHYLTLAHFPLHFIAAALMGCVVNFLSLSVVKATSALTLKILISVRSVVLVILAIVFYNEIMTTLELAGFVVAFIGAAGYFNFTTKRS